jgi:tRNA (guanine37-N1)-methyltransferase
VIPDAKRRATPNVNAPCVQVPREEGEATREALAEAALIDRDLEISGGDEHLYIPVSDPAAVPPSYEVVEHDVEPRETQTLPGDILGSEPTYERLGDIAIIDEDDPEHARKVAVAIADSDLPLTAVLNKRSEVKGTERVRDWELLVGEDTETTHREYGCSFALDVAAVYFSPRLATERHRVVEQVDSGECIFDMFAGVGPFTIPMARRGKRAVGVDINADAIAYLKQNARRNDVADRVTGISGDVREVTPEYAGWADRIVMNLPHSADTFLDAAMIAAGGECTIHYYDIQPEEDPFAPGRRAIETAAAAADYAVTVETERVVRSYSPREVNVCIDARLSSSRESTARPNHNP